MPRRDHPVQQRRLLEPWLAVEARRDPVAGASHFSTNSRVARLVRTEKSGASEAQQIHEEQRNEQPVFVDSRGAERQVSSIMRRGEPRCAASWKFWGAAEKCCPATDRYFRARAHSMRLRA